jgi:hypothetical protein
LAACNANNSVAPTSLENQLRGNHISACISAAEGNDVALSKQNEVFIWGDYLRIQEKLYTNDDKCSTQPESPAKFETTVKFKEIDTTTALPPGFHELSISEYHVTVWAGPLSKAFAEAKYCERDDWMTVFSANADITECQQKQYGENSRDKQRWFIEVGADSVRLGFLKGSKFDLKNIEWLEPGDFQK